ncbi:MAG: cation:proton antiporter [Oscillospiraceae bacterium]|nr:cation:proton antiporter [Oscillospiraceae bacterium]
MLSFLKLGTNLAHSPKIILMLAAMLFAGFFMTRLTKRLHLPNVTGYILSGVVIGPYALGLIDQDAISHMDFVNDIALAFIAFGVGQYFKVITLRKSGRQVVSITLWESLAAAVLVTLSMHFLFRFSWPFSLLLGAIGCATAPASTIMTIQQYGAKGPFVDLILQIVALDDAVALIAFSICAAVVQASGTGVVSAGLILKPILFNLLALLFGLLFGFILHRAVDTDRSVQHRLALTIAIILALTGACAAMDISPLLSCMVLGACYINIGGSKNLFDQANRFISPVLLLFFVLAGARLNLPSLLTAGAAGAAYFLIRIGGKYLGAYTGCRLAKTEKPTQQFLGLALIPQAGVSIGLAALGQRLLPNETGTLLSTIILSSGLLYEIIGPACAKASLFWSGAVETNKASCAKTEAASPGRLSPSA